MVTDAPSFACCDERLRPLLLRLLLHPDRLAFTPAPGPCVGLRTLPTGGHAFAVPEPAIARDIHQPFDVQLNLAPQVTLDTILAVDNLADPPKLILSQVAGPRLAADIRLAKNVLAVGCPIP